MIVEYFEPMAAPDTPNTDPFIRRSEHKGGCGEEHCLCSDGHWISISDGKRGVKFSFDTLSELEDFRYKIGQLGR